MEDYVLGGTAGEHERLERQAAVMAPLTHAILTAAGLAPGMRVLDLGCGPGDVSRIAAAIVGPAGAVVGIDRDATALERARARVTGPARVTFVEGDAFSELPEGPFDAIVGRLVLMYAKDPAAQVRRFRDALAPGGIIAFQETDIASARTVPPVASVMDNLDRIRRTFEAGGADPAMGLKLDRTFRAAGLVPQMVGGTALDGHGEGFCPAWVVSTVRSMLPIMGLTGIASAEDVGIETLEERVRSDLREAGALSVGPMMIGAWARVP